MIPPEVSLLDAEEEVFREELKLLEQQLEERRRAKEGTIWAWVLLVILILALGAGLYAVASFLLQQL